MTGCDWGRLRSWRFAPGAVLDSSGVQMAPGLPICGCGGVLAGCASLAPQRAVCYNVHFKLHQVAN